MQNKQSIQKMTIAALLIAIGIVIPMFSPIRILLEPASFTLASHVPVFIAMFISPWVAAAVAVGTTLGFFMGAFPIVVVLRAASHIVFVLLGSLYVSRHRNLLDSAPKTILFSLATGLIHAACEVTVVSIFYAIGGMGGLYYERGFFVSVMLLVGVGTVVHSMVDFFISTLVIKPLGRQRSFRHLFMIGGSADARNKTI